jgi:hypothetical protein
MGYTRRGGFSSVTQRHAGCWSARSALVALLFRARTSRRELGPVLKRTDSGLN